jgi:hypothetical protein
MEMAMTNVPNISNILFPEWYPKSMADDDPLREVLEAARHLDVTCNDGEFRITRNVMNRSLRPGKGQTDHDLAEQLRKLAGLLQHLAMDPWMDALLHPEKWPAGTGEPVEPAGGRQP